MDGVAQSRTVTRLRVLTSCPKDDTPTCTTQACAFRDARADYEKAGAKVFGISPDNVKAHGKFAAKYGLKFTLLADTEMEICSAYGVWKEKSMFGRKYMGVERTTFLIDREGVVRKVFAKVKVDGHADAVLAVLKTL